MPITKGQPWGRPGRLPVGGVVVASDGEARQVIEQARTGAEPIPVLGLRGGDLWRTVGGSELVSPDHLHSDEAMTFPVDLGRAVIDGTRFFFVAHAIAHSRLWRRTFVALNAQWRGDWDLGPRSHPNDGLLDTFDAQLSFDDLWKVRSRLPTGTHLPHPRIKERRTSHVEVAFNRAMTMELDGCPVGRGRSLAVSLETDALTVVI